MNSAASIPEASAKRYSPIFLGVFAVFLIATVVCVAGTILGVVTAIPSHHDTQWFWASGHLLAHRENPYDQIQIRQLENGLGLHAGLDLPMTRNPPPALLLMEPLGYLGPRAAIIAWSLFLATCLIISVAALRPRLPILREKSYLWLALCFAPALLGIEMGQPGLVALLALALFLLLEDRWPFWAGAAFSLCAMKPHILLPFGLVLLAWILFRRRWMILAGLFAALAAESLAVMTFDQAVWIHYLIAIRKQDFTDEFVPTFGVALRYAVDRKAMWLQFVPAAAGCAWGLWFFLRNRKVWDWKTHGSLLTLVSLVVAPYAWFTDQVIAIPAILFALTASRRPRRGSVTLLLAVMSAAAIEMTCVKSLYFKPYMLQGAAWLAWYLYAVSGNKSTPAEKHFAAA